MAAHLIALVWRRQPQAALQCVACSHGVPAVLGCHVLGGLWLAAGLLPGRVLLGMAVYMYGLWAPFAAAAMMLMALQPNQGGMLDVSGERTGGGCGWAGRRMLGLGRWGDERDGRANSGGDMAFGTGLHGRQFGTAPCGCPECLRCQPTCGLSSHSCRPIRNLPLACRLASIRLAACTITTGRAPAALPARMPTALTTVVCGPMSRALA